jgi:hypothetical protein
MQLAYRDPDTSGYVVEMRLLKAHAGVIWAFDAA